MNLNKYKKIAIIGFGLEGKSLLGYLESINFNGEVFIMDRDISLDFPDTFLNVSMLLGKTYLNNLDQVDVVFKSSGVPLRLPEVQNAQKQGVVVTSIVNLFFSLNKKPVIAVSGTKGKSSTVTFINDVLKKSGFRTQLIGNIGNPVLDYLNQDVDFFVFEISSYMLETFDGKIDFGVFTSFFPDHMDTHGSYENYKKAKFNFFKVCKNLFVNDQNIDVKEFLNSNSIDYSSFDQQQVFFEDAKVNIFGKIYNLINNLGLEIKANFVGAILCLKNLGIKDCFIVDALNNFKNLPHRQEVIDSKMGFYYIDDSASITPESTILAIENFKSNLKVLILGGQNRGYDYSKLNELILKLKIPFVFIMPDLQEVDFSFEHQFVRDFDELNMHLKKIDLDDSLVLFSPGGPSYNQYKNFSERGELFRKAINDLNS